MHYKYKEIQLQYNGFLNTHFLWKGTFSLFNLKSLNTIFCKGLFQLKIENKLRLGKLVEQFVFNELSLDPTVQIITKNLQIQDNKITVGELDCIILKNNQPIHVEIIYKFYLYDASVGNSEIEHWIGPNRKDSLIEKLNKLSQKQLPLLYHPKTIEKLSELNLNSNDIKQQVYFKAQLFPHLNDYKKTFEVINNDCISGFYIYENELEQFENCKFYIPTKLNWLMQPHTNIDWLTFEAFLLNIKKDLKNNYAPLIWLKKPTGELFKFFVVWW
ncbi:DUF1853 family protein [Tenacibaculum geojense]|uniref:DUF1853 family protein n=1 Tax=Tenacibaculum geojense TaxID=915352 RepID=A0ABW3JMW1_9FLAO